MAVVTKSQSGTPVLRYGSGSSTAVKQLTEYQQEYKCRPLQPVRRGCKPEYPTWRHVPMQKRTSYTTDYAPRSNFCESSWNTEALVSVKDLPPEPLTFEDEPIYGQSCPTYKRLATRGTVGYLDTPAMGATVMESDTMKQGKPKPKPSSPKCDTIPTKEPTVNDHEKTIPLSEPIAKATIKPKDKSIQNITSTRKTTKYKEAKFQMGAEIKPKFGAISTAMADFVAPKNPQRRNPKIPVDNMEHIVAAFEGETTFKDSYKEWPIVPYEQHARAKGPAYELRTGGFATESVYGKMECHVCGKQSRRNQIFSMGEKIIFSPDTGLLSSIGARSSIKVSKTDFRNPSAVESTKLVRPMDRSINIITNKSESRPFNHVTTYDSDYQYTEGARPPTMFCVKVKSKLPSKPMATETMHMSDYKAHELYMTSPIRHASQHRELYDNHDMCFDTTYSVNFQDVEHYIG